MHILCQASVTLPTFLSWDYVCTVLVSHWINSASLFNALFPSGITSESHVAVCENNHSSFRTTCWSAS